MHPRFLLCDAVTGASSPLFPPALTRQPVGWCHFSFTFNFISFFIRHSVFSFFNATQFCSFSFFKFTDVCFSISTQCCQSYKLVESGLTTNCPFPVSARQINISHVYTLLSASSLTVVPSRVFRKCGFFATTTTMFPARTTV